MFLHILKQFRGSYLENRMNKQLNSVVGRYRLGLGRYPKFESQQWLFRGQGVPSNTEQGPSTGNVPNHIYDMRSIEILDSEGELVCVCLPPCVSNELKAIEKYSECLSSLASFRIPLTFSAPNIPIFKRAYQIPDSVKIRALSPEERACYYRPGEVYFYEAAFGHGLRFPIDDHIRELLATMDLAPTEGLQKSYTASRTAFLIGRTDSSLSQGKTGSMTRGVPAFMTSNTGSRSQILLVSSFFSAE
ncbi:hypothetical protein LguiB_013247 [Lonicera macranthoides]